MGELNQCMQDGPNSCPESFSTRYEISLPVQLQNLHRLPNTFVVRIYKLKVVFNTLTNSPLLMPSLVLRAKVNLFKCSRVW